MRRFTYHVFTPFSRFQNLLYMAKRLKTAGVQWHPIFDADVPFSITGDWIHPMVCPTKEPGWFPGHWYQNYWVEHVEIDPEARYIMCSDDDDYEVGFFDKMDAVDGDVLICSMHRPSLGGTLPADPSHLGPGYMGGEQIMMSGRVIKDSRWTYHGAGDWDYIAGIIAKHPPVFVPQATVWWNVLDTGKPKDYHGDNQT